MGEWWHQVMPAEHEGQWGDTAVGKTSLHSCGENIPTQDRFLQAAVPRLTRDRAGKALRGSNFIMCWVTTDFIVLLFILPNSSHSCNLKMTRSHGMAYVFSSQGCIPAGAVPWRVKCCQQQRVHGEVALGRVQMYGKNCPCFWASVLSCIHGKSKQLRGLSALFNLIYYFFFSLFFF